MEEEEIQALEGRELDAAIEEHLFGWQWIHHPNRDKAQLCAPPIATRMMGSFGWLAGDGGKPRYFGVTGTCPTTWEGIGAMTRAMEERAWRLSLTGPFEKGDPWSGSHARAAEYRFRTGKRERMDRGAAYVYRQAIRDLISKLHLLLVA